MMSSVLREQAPIPPPAYQRAQARRGPALHIDALTLVRTLHLQTLCRLAVRLAHHRCPPPLPAGPGGAPRIYSAFPVPPNNASAVKPPERPCQRPCSW